MLFRSPVRDAYDDRYDALLARVVEKGDACAQRDLWNEYGVWVEVGK